MKFLLHTHIHILFVLKLSDTSCRLRTFAKFEITDLQAMTDVVCVCVRAYVCVCSIATPNVAPSAVMFLLPHQTAR